MTRKNKARICIYLPLLVLLLCISPRLIAVYGPFTPPDFEKRQQALDDISKLSPELQALYQESPSFSPLPVPEKGDWLEGGAAGRADRYGQTVPQFVNSWSRHAVTADRRIIYIQLWDKELAKHTSLIDHIQTFTEAFFQLPVVVLYPEKKSTLDITSRTTEGHRQLLTGDIMNALMQTLPQDAYCAIALTRTDLYPKDSWAFVFGEARPADRVGVFSLARYGQMRSDPKYKNSPLKPLFLQRTMKVISHEAGHLFSLNHCIYYHCDMNGSGGLEEADKAPLHLCPVCLRKLHLAIGFDPIKRYEDLLAFYKSCGLKDEADWVTERLSHLRSQ